MAVSKIRKSTQKYDPDTIYNVRVNKVVPGKATTLRPKGAYRIRGRFLNTLPAVDIKSAEPV